MSNFEWTEHHINLVREFGNSDFSDADLRGADLSSANLSSANLSDITFNYQSHQLISEVLIRAKTNHAQGMFAAYVAVRPDMCWGDWLKEFADDTRLEWALRELSKWHKDGDNAPECVLKYVVKDKGEKEAEGE